MFIHFAWTQAVDDLLTMASTLECLEQLPALTYTAVIAAPVRCACMLLSPGLRPLLPSAAKALLIDRQDVGAERGRRGCSSGSTRHRLQQQQQLLYAAITLRAHTGTRH